MKNFANPPVTFPLQVMDFPGGRAESDQASFWESFAMGNFEIAMKMADACSFPPGHPLRDYWVFFGALTDEETDMTIHGHGHRGDLDLPQPAEHVPDHDRGHHGLPLRQPGGNTELHRQRHHRLPHRRPVQGDGLDGEPRAIPTGDNFPNKVIQAAQSRRDRSGGLPSRSKPGNFEVGVKMLNACALPPGHPLRFSWIFYGGLTNAATEVRAVDTTPGASTSGATRGRVAATTVADEGVPLFAGAVKPGLLRTRRAPLAGTAPRRRCRAPAGRPARWCLRRRGRCSRA